MRGVLLGCLGIATTLGALLAGTGGLQNAVANGDTRTLSLYHAHTRESLTVTFRRNGRYDRAELQKLNWFLRDWRNDETTSMDPKLFDIVWAAQREAGSSGSVKVLSAYRSPKTNAMLRRRSSAVAKNSQHMQGRALDFQLPDADMAKVRAVGMRLQRGGVGYYPNVPFVHLDSGSVRSWPRMPRNQLERLFPDGRTVHLPADGRPLDGYETAKQTILARGDLVPGVSAAAVAAAAHQPERRRSLWAALFGGADEEEDAELIDSSSRRQVAARTNTRQVVARDESVVDDDGDPRRFFLNDGRAANTASRPSAPPPAAPAPAPAPVQVAAPVRAPTPAPPSPAPVVAPPPPAAPPAIEAPPVAIAQGRPVRIMPDNIPTVPVRETPVLAFNGPLPVARPAADSTALASLASASAVGLPVQPEAKPVSFAALPLPPVRPGAAQPAPETVAVAAAVLPAIPAPPTRPAELTPAVAAGPGTDRNALAAIAAASRGWNEGEADATIQTAALAYAPAPAVPAPPLPPSRPVAAQQPVRLSPSLPATAANNTVSSEERRGLNQLFAMVATEAKPSPRARVSTAKVAAKPAAPAPARVSAAAPKVVVEMAFTRGANVSDLSTDSFSGPAVKPLPVARFGQ